MPKRSHIRFLVMMFVAVVATITKGFAQQDAQFSHYMFTQLYYNPAYTGLEDHARVDLLHRSQWLGYETSFDGAGGAPTTQLLSFNHPLTIGSFADDINSGVGMNITHDQLGPRRDIKANVSLAYHFPLSGLGRSFAGSKISLGISGGFYSQSIDGSILRSIEDNDPTIDQIGPGVQNQMKPDFAAGLTYKSQKGNWLGVSFNHLNSSEFDFGGESSFINSKLVNHMYIHGQYHIPLNSTIELRPSGIVQTDFKETTFNIGALVNYNPAAKNDYWGGLTFRQSLATSNAQDGTTSNSWALDDISIIVGMGLLKDKTGLYNTLRLSYAFDLVVSGKEAKQPTSHEIMLSYLFGSGTPKARPVKYSPRYYHIKE